MAFNDPQSVTVGATAYTLPRQITGDGTGLFIAPEGAVQLDIRPFKKTGAKRSSASMRTTKITSDPLVTSVNMRVTELFSFTINRPREGYSDADVLAEANAFIAWLKAGTDANLKKLIAGEN